MRAGGTAGKGEGKREKKGKGQGVSSNWAVAEGLSRPGLEWTL